MIVLEVVIAGLDVTAKPGWVVTALGRGKAHEISDVLLLELEEDIEEREEREETLLFVKKISIWLNIYALFLHGLITYFFILFSFFILFFLDFIVTSAPHYHSCYIYVIDVIIAIQIYAYLMLGQLDGRGKHFKSPGSPKSIVQEILNYILIFRKF